MSPIDDNDHPTWCDLTRCTGEDHFSAGTMLPLGAAHVTTSLRLSDDFDPRTKTNAATPRIWLTVEDVEVCGVFGDVMLEPEDARLLADVLGRWADQCERERKFGGRRYPAETLRKERAH